MMQNRSNRNLLFGSRSAASASGGDVQTESLEADNQRGVDRIGGSASAMKDIAIAIDADVADQNKVLDTVDRRFETTTAVVANAMNSLNDLVNDRTGTKLSTIIGATFAVLVVAYLFLKR